MNDEQNKAENIINEPINTSEEMKRSEKTMSAICYIPVLFLIPFFVIKNRSKSLNFHINQGIILTILFILGFFIISTVIPYISDEAKNIWKLIILIFAIIGIMNVSKEKDKPLPFIGKLMNFTNI